MPRRKTRLPIIGHRPAVADRACVLAQHFVGLALRDGHGVKKDEEAAVGWFKKAASAGRAEAQYELGVCCEHGIGTEKRWAEALGWFELAAAQGNQDAIDRLQLNRDVPLREEKEEEKWCDHMKVDMDGHLRKCGRMAQEGDLCAMFHWARCHIQAWGVPPNLPLGAQWMAKAAAKRHRAACYELGRLYQLENTRRKHTQATLYFQLAAEKGHAGAMFELGVSYRKGRGVERDFEQSVVYLRSAAEKCRPLPPPAARRRMSRALRSLLRRGKFVPPAVAWRAWCSACTLLRSLLRRGSARVWNPQPPPAACLGLRLSTRLRMRTGPRSGLAGTMRTHSSSCRTRTVTVMGQTRTRRCTSSGWANLPRRAAMRQRSSTACTASRRSGTPMRSRSSRRRRARGMRTASSMRG